MEPAGATDSSQSGQITAHTLSLDATPKASNGNATNAVTLESGETRAFDIVCGLDPVVSAGPDSRVAGSSETRSLREGSSRTGG